MFFCKLFMESVLLKANLVNLSTGQYWLKIDEEKGMLDREGHGHKAVLYKSHFPPLRHSVLERHHCIHRLIIHVYYKDQAQSYSLPPRQIIELILSLAAATNDNLCSGFHFRFPTSARFNPECSPSLNAGNK